MAFKISDDFRENSLSFVPGGCTVFVKFSNGKVYEYNKVHYPFKYINKLKKDNPDVVSAWFIED